MVYGFTRNECCVNYIHHQISQTDPSSNWIRWIWKLIFHIKIKTSKHIQGPLFWGTWKSLLPQLLHIHPIPPWTSRSARRLCHCSAKGKSPSSAAAWREPASPVFLLRYVFCQEISESKSLSCQCCQIYCWSLLLHLLSTKATSCFMHARHPKHAAEEQKGHTSTREFQVHSR